METIFDKFKKQVSEQMEQLSHVQALLVAACAIERLWMLFSGWTKQDSTPYFKVKPKAFREPVRRLLDLFWERIWNEPPSGDHKQLFNQVNFFLMRIIMREAPKILTLETLGL